MFCKPFLFPFIISLFTVCADNTFILSYFKYKLASYIVGYTCNTIKEDIELIKNFSNAGIFSTVNGINFNSTMEPFLTTHYRKLGVFLDSRCYSIAENQYLLTEASSSLFYGELHYWLLLGRDLEESIEMLNDTEYSASTDFVIAIIKDTEIVMYDVFNLCKYRGGLLNVTQLGSWNSRDGFNITLTQSKFARRANLHGMVLRMIVLLIDKKQDLPLDVYLQDYASKQNDTMAKFAFAAWQHVAELYNFTIEINEVKVKKLYNRNGPLIKMLADRLAEISGNTAILTPERIHMVSASPIWPLRTCFMFRTTQSKRIKVNHFLRPLAKATWYWTIVFMFMAALVFAWVLIVEQRDRYERYSDSILFTIGSLCQQATDLQVTKASSRIALLQTMIFSLLLYNYYSASVVSARLSEPLEKINDSLNELAKTNLKFGAEPTIYFNFYIKRSDWEGQQFYYKRWVKIPEEERFMPASVGMRRVLQGGFAYHIDVNTAFPVVERLFENKHVCQLTMVYLVPPTDTSMLTASNGSFVEMARVGVARVRETGLRSRLIQKWAVRTPQCRTDIIEIDSISVYEVAPAFLLLIFGAIFALIVWSVEKIAHFRYKDFEFKKKLTYMYTRFCNSIMRNKK